MGPPPLRESGPHEKRARPRGRTRRLSRESPGLEATLLGRHQLALAADRRLLVMLAPANLRENAVLLDLLVEAAKRALEGLALADLDLRHGRVLTSFVRPGLFVARPAVTLPDGQVPPAGSSP